MIAGARQQQIAVRRTAVDIKQTRSEDASDYIRAPCCVRGCVNLAAGYREDHGQAKHGKSGKPKTTGLIPD
jgi:hypothetical protein